MSGHGCLRGGKMEKKTRKKKCDSCWKQPLCNLRTQAGFDTMNCNHYANFQNAKKGEGYP